jgi:uncharacterized protein YxjI
MHDETKGNLSACGFKIAPNVRQRMDKIKKKVYEMTKTYGISTKTQQHRMNNNNNNNNNIPSV